MDLFSGSPDYEQGLLNILAFERKVPVFDLPLSLNYLLDCIFCQDWRRGTLIHVAGGGKKIFKLSRVWQEENFKNSKYLSEIDFKPPYVRVPRLIEIAAQVAGKEVHIFDADDFHYASPFSYPLLRNSNLYISLGAKPDGNLTVFGPHTSIRAGRWRVCVLAPDNTTCSSPVFRLISVLTMARTYCRPPRSWKARISGSIYQLKSLTLRSN